VLQIFGFFGDTEFGGDHDMDVGDAGDSHDAHGHGADGHGNLFFGILSFKALCAFAGIFGLVGLMLLKDEVSTQARIGIAFISGISSMFLVAWLMRGISRLQSSGTLKLANAIGRNGSVYLRIPGGGNGAGKVTIEIQGRSQEFSAITDGEDIDTGSRVTVVSIEGDDTLKVVPS
jgi:membrane protein implicated in regulation of membrane protease activity